MWNDRLTLKECDAELSKMIDNEQQRQEEHIELIASENYASQRILEAQGSVLTNKYAEGYPSKRYYGGCEYVDQVENLAIERAKTLFEAQFANVQPHSGSQANAAAYMALMQPGDTLLGMSLSEGGHLTHGSNVSFSGKLYKAVQYGLDPKTGDIDYNQVEDLAKLHKPKLIVAGFSAFSGIINWNYFREIADRCGSKLLVDMAHVAGLVAAKLYPSPIGIADVVTSTTHKTLAGPRGGIILANDNEELNKKLNFSVFPANQGGPLCHIIAAKAVCFKEAMTKEFVAYQKQVIKNAQLMCQILQERNYKIVGNGTQNHLFLIDLKDKNYTGKDAEKLLGEANITVNKNTVPNDHRSPFVTSGLRIGTPAITRRGFKEDAVTQLSHWISDLLDALEKKSTTQADQVSKIKNKVVDLCKNHPVYK